LKDARITARYSRLIRKFLRPGEISVILLLLAVLSLLAVSPFYIYSVFNQELPVARLEFVQLGEMEYLATVTSGSSCIENTYPVFGDQFQLDAGFVKWKGAAVLLGFKPRFRLDRLSGRYSDTQQQNSLKTVSHDLAPDLVFDFFADFENNSDNSWLVDTSFGSSVYQEINPLFSYTVYATEDSLILRQSPILEYAEDTGILMIDITQGCADTNTTFRNLLLKVNLE